MLLMLAIQLMLRKMTNLESKFQDGQINIQKSLKDLWKF